jgi:hypothetical protein
VRIDGAAARRERRRLRAGQPSRRSGPRFPPRPDPRVARPPSRAVRGSWETEAYPGAGDPRRIRSAARRRATHLGPPGTVRLLHLRDAPLPERLGDREGAPGASHPRRGALGGGEARVERPGTPSVRPGPRRQRHGLAPGSRLYLRVAPRRISVSTRIGIRQAADRALR